MIEWRRGSHVQPVEILKRRARLWLLTLVDSEAIGQSSGRGSAPSLISEREEGKEVPVDEPDARPSLSPSRKT